MVKTSITHNKYLTPRLLEDNHSSSSKSAAQILFLNLAYTFLLLNFLITDLCGSQDSSSLTFPPALLVAILPIFLFHQKIYRPYLLILCDIHRI